MGFPQFDIMLALTTGGVRASPSLSVDGSSMLANVRIPARALFKSVQLGSFWPGPNWHIEPVRSSTTMMSSGFTEHGAHAVAVALTVSSVIPMIRPNHVGTLDCA